LTAVPGDESDESDEWDLQASEEEWEGPGDLMYRDYRRVEHVFDCIYGETGSECEARDAAVDTSHGAVEYWDRRW
jgi:hypothetical protein